MRAQLKKFIFDDSFDDLLVGAPFEYFQDENNELGGAVYIFYSRGAKQPKDASHRVFLEPLVLRVGAAHSQFGRDSLFPNLKVVSNCYELNDHRLWLTDGLTSTPSVK